MKNFIILFLIILILPFTANAADFGLLMNQYAGYDSGENFEYRAGFLPRFSLLLGDTENNPGSFIVSASLTAGFEAEEFYFTPELMRTEFSMRFGALGLRAGRINYSDPLSFIADGLFDGFQLTHTSPFGRFGFGAWYTGLLYKKTTVITMTNEDMGNYATLLDYSDFSNTYFASSRAIASLDWYHPAVAELLQVNASVTGQFDLTGNDEKINSQYFTLKLGLPAGRFFFEAGGAVEAIQLESSDNDSDFNLAFAGILGFYWNLPSSFNSRFSLTAKYTSGKNDDTLGPFIPITTKYYGEVFQAKMSGLSVVALNYSGRLHETVGLSLTGSYFIRNDLVTFTGYPVHEDADGYLLGGELAARIVWSPVSDLQLNIGGGIFLPSLGDTMPDGDSLWRVDLTAVFALY